MNRVTRFALLLGLATAGCAGETRQESVAWARYDEDYAQWRVEHDRWERQKAARDRRVEQGLERQWPKPTSDPPADPLAPGAERDAAPAPRAPGRPAVAAADWTPAPPRHYVPEDERVVVERSSGSVDIDVGVGVGVGYVGYGAYVGPRVYHRPRVTLDLGARPYYSSYYRSYGRPHHRASYYDPCPPRSYDRRPVFVAPRPYCPPAPRAYCPPVIVVAPRHHGGGHRSGHGVRSFSNRPSYTPPAAPAPAPVALPSWSVKN